MVNNANPGLKVFFSRIKNVFHFLCYVRFEIIEAQNWKTKNIESRAKKLQNWNLKFSLILDFEQPGLPMFTPDGFNLFFHIAHYFRLCEAFGENLLHLQWQKLWLKRSFLCLWRNCGLSRYFGCVRNDEGPTTPQLLRRINYSTPFIAD